MLARFHNSKFRKTLAGQLTCFLHRAAIATTLLSVSSQVLAQDAPTPSELVPQMGHARPVSALTFSPDGNTLVSVSSDRTVKLWDARSGELKYSLGGLNFEPQAVAYSPDGSTVVVGGTPSHSWANTDELSILLLDGHTGHRTGSVRLPDFVGIKDIAFSPDGQLLAAMAYPQQRLMLWDLKTKKLLSNTPESGQIGGGVQFTPDGKYLVSCAGRDIHVTEVASGKRIAVFKAANGEQLGLAVAPDGSTIASARVMFSDKLVSSFVDLRDFKTGKVLKTLEAPGMLQSLNFTGDGKSLISSYGMMVFGVVISWDVSTGKAARTLYGLGDFVCPSAISPDGKLLVAGSTVAVPSLETADLKEHATGDIQIWDAGSGQPLRVLHGGEIPMTGLAVATNGSVEVSAFSELDTFAPDYDGNWKPSAVLAVIQPGSDVKWRPSTFPVAMQPDGRRVLFEEFSGKSESTLVLRDANTLRPLHSYRPLTKFWPDAAGLSADGKFIVHHGEQDVTAKNGQTSLTSLLVARDAATGLVVKKIQTIPTNTPAALSLAPNSPIAAITGKISVRGESKAAVQLLNIATGQALNTLVLPKDPGGQAFSDLLLPKDLVMADDGVVSLAWSFDGRKIAARRPFGFCVWDVASGRLIRAIRTIGSSSDADVNGPRFGDFHPICFSQDGKFIATETAIFTVCLWDISSGKMVREFSGHTDAISGLAFYSGGKILLSTGLDGRLCIWDISTGTLKGTLRFLPSVKPKANGFEWVVDTPGKDFVTSPGAKASLRGGTGRGVARSLRRTGELSRGCCKRY